MAILERWEESTNFQVVLHMVGWFLPKHQLILWLVVLHMVVLQMVVLHMVGWCLFRHQWLRLWLVAGVGDLDSGAEVNTLVLHCPKSTYRSAFLFRAAIFFGMQDICLKTKSNVFLLLPSWMWKLKCEKSTTNLLNHYYWWITLDCDKKMI